ncbi:MAG TPA: 4'-phosphopantetheinyl transferase superfamily protein, partial [Spirillospora sp.]|nr:4'-phosphopantetheinyl transferase superfamily protein [Spirillospora sp.]
HSNEKFRALLSEDEQARAAGFKFEHLRQHYTAGRAILRLILSRYLQTPPQDITFQYNDYGKPELPATDLQFNLSHSGGLALYAFIRQHRIGIDIERMRPLTDIETMMRHYFSQSECASLLALPQHLRVQGFYNCWTRKEAYIKAIGRGLSQPLDSFAVSLTPGKPPRLLRVEGEPEASQRWTIFDLPVPSGFQAALAVEHPGSTLNLWQFTP